MYEMDKKSVRAVARLIELTQQGELKWRPVELDQLARAGTSATFAFETELDGERLQLYHSESTRTSRLLRPLEPRASNVLCILNEGGSAVYKFPDSQAVDDLMNAVLKHSSKIMAFLDSLAQ